MKKHYTLALNMIVGPNDGELLDRCLSAFDCRRLFDEIVIVATTNDPKVHSVSKKFATKFLSKQWTSERYPFGDFAGARNLALDNTESDYVMWLDSDDVLTAANMDVKIGNLRDSLDAHSSDVVFINYCLEVDKNGNETFAIQRERIWKRSTGIRWAYPCHEQLPFDWSKHKKIMLTGITNLHQPVKAQPLGVNRNIKILQNEYFNAETRNPHVAYYYARDLSLVSPATEGVPILVDMIRSFNGDSQNIFEAALSLSKFYLYGKSDAMGTQAILTENIDIAESYVRTALASNTLCAEPYVFLGDVMLAKDKKDDAILCYKQAMQKDYGNGAAQQIAYYEAIPASRLSAIYIERKEWEMALWYNKLALIYFSDNSELKKDRRMIIDNLVKSNE